MNYHLLIDHWFVDDFIETAERIAKGHNSYIVISSDTFKYVKSELAVHISDSSLVFGGTIQRYAPEDKVYVHWFDVRIMSVVNSLPKFIPLYLIFWGGDFVGHTKRQFNFNHDNLTREYLRSLNAPDFSGSWRHPFRFAKKFKGYLQKSLTEGRELKEGLELRKAFMRRLNFFCHWNELDLKKVIEEYGGNPTYVSFFYGRGFDSLFAFPVLDVTKKDRTTIWLGNSDTATNNHLDALDILSKFKNENLRITCPLSYGFPKYGNLIDEKGRDIFGEKWHALRELLSVEQYTKEQQNSDIAIMHHNRSQASGNVIAFVHMGKKVYLKSQSTLFQLLVSNGIKIFDANSIRDLNFEEFSEPLAEEQARLNSMAIIALFSNERKVNGYKKLLLT